MLTSSMTLLSNEKGYQQTAWLQLQFNFTLTKMAANGRRGGRSAASMLLFRSPDGGTLSMLASPQLPLTNQPSTFQGKNILAFLSIFRFRMFSKKCVSSQEEAKNRREVRNEEDSCQSWPS